MSTNHFIEDYSESIKLTKFLHNVSNPFLKGLCKFQFDIPVNTGVVEVGSLEISVFLYCGSHVGGHKNAHQPIFPYNIIENSPISLAHNTVFFGPNSVKFGTETSYVV